ncbi:MAG: hypothetical protein HYZ53_18910 [Planctomycetes bacterium]|nr:hypothetical protein [Planctomycetota bacterium]
MGITLRYRGRLRDMETLETLEDRLIELSMELDGYARIWRTSTKEKPERIVRGALLDLAPGLDPVSFLIAPEGWLLPLGALEEVEEGTLTEAPWVVVRTEYGAVEAHTGLVDILAALRRDFIPDLEVSDEGGYWSSHDLELLCSRRQRSRSPAPRTGPEAEDGAAMPARRVARVAEQVRRAFERPLEHPPVRFVDSGESAVDERRYGTEAEWDAWYREHRRKQERLMRAFGEGSLHGKDPREAFEEAMRSEGIVSPFEEGGEGEAEAETTKDEGTGGEESWSATDAEEVIAEATREAKGEAWRESLRPDAEEKTHGAEDGDPDAGEAGEGEDVPADPAFDAVERHPMARRLRRLTLRVLRLSKDPTRVPAGPLDSMMRGVVEMSGGLVQALPEGEDDDTPYGHRLVELKRALRGASFMRGALFPARAEGLVDAATFDYILREVADIERGMLEELQRTRAKL